MYLNTKHHDPEPELLSPEQAAAFLGCSSDLVVRMLGRKQLPGIKVGRAWRIPREALAEALLTMAKDHWALPARVKVSVVQMPVLVLSSPKKAIPKSKGSRSR